MLRKMIATLCAAAVLAAVPAFAAGKLSAGETPKDFTLKDMEGKDWTLSSFTGKKPVVIAFWQSACGSCVADMQFLSGMKEKHKNVEFVAINVDIRGGSDAWKASMKDYLSEKKVTLPILLDPKFTVGRGMGIGATPATVLLNKDGKALAVELGFTSGESEKEVEDLIKKLQ